MSIVPSITGKIELVYEGEQEGADEVAKTLIDNAVLIQFSQLFPRISKLEKEGAKTPYTDLIQWFDTNFIELNYTDTDQEFYTNLNAIEPLVAVVEDHVSNLSKADQYFCMELVLWGLTLHNKLDKSENNTAFKFDAAGINQYFK
jgi:magnesium chelatase subunit I